MRKPISFEQELQMPTNRLSPRKRHMISSIVESDLGSLSHAMKLLHQRQACAIMYNQTRANKYIPQIRELNKQIIELLNLDL